MVDWEIRRFLGVFLGIQLALLGLVGLAALGFDIAVLRQLIGFIYLTLIPGVIILRLLKLHKLGIVETLLYSVGLSLAFNMFLGLLINMAYPFIGISNPLSTYPIVITWAIVLGILCFLAYKRGKGLSVPSQLKMAELLSPPVLFLSLLPLLAVLGAEWVNLYQDNLVLLVLIVLIAFTAILVVFTTFIPARLYPLAVFSIALGLLWHWSLISQYLWGYDIHIEYYYQNLVLTNSFWDPSLPSSVNAMLSITMLAPIYSLLLNIDTIWIFKIVYPVFFSLLPLALFQVFRKQTNDRIAFFAVFFFMSFYLFFSGMLDLARMQIAELFFALSILLLLDRGMAAVKRAVLLMIFGLCTMVSHYGLSYFYLFYLLLAVLLLSLARSNTLISLWRGLGARFSKGKYSADITNPLSTSVGKLPAMSALSANFVTLLVVFCLAWYMYTASGSPFNSIVRIGDHLYHSLGEFSNPETRDPAILLAVGLASPEVASVQRSIFLVIQYITQFFIVVGVIGLLFNLRKTKFQPVYVAMTLVSSLLLLLSILVPYFAEPFNMTRIYHITLFFLAPFCLLGGITTFRWLFKVVSSRLFRTSTNPIYLNLVVTLILIPYFLFSTAFIYVVTGDVVTSMALNPEMESPRFNEQEVSGEGWLLSGMSPGSRVCADAIGKLLFFDHVFWGEVAIFYGETSETPDNTYIYLRSLNVKQGEVWQSWKEEQRHKYIQLQSSPFGKEVLAHRNKIYDNGGAQVYR